MVTLFLLTTLNITLYCQTFEDGAGNRIILRGDSGVYQREIVKQPFKLSFKSRYKVELVRIDSFHKISENRFKIGKQLFEEFQYGSCKLLVNVNFLQEYDSIEDILQDAIISIPYDQFNWESTNPTYIKLRNLTIVRLQYWRTRRVLFPRFKNKVLLEVPDHLDTYFVQYPPYSRRPSKLWTPY